jgi:hypothetical protein
MRIYKGSETTLKLPIHVCGVDDVNIDRVILYTTDANNAVIVNNVYVSGETLNVRVESKTFDLMEDGVINYIAEGGTTHIEKQSSYYLKTPKDYVAISLETQDKDVTVTKNNSTTVIKPDEGYVGLDEVRVYTDISLEENKSYEFTENNTSFDIVPDEGYVGIKSGKVSVNIPTQQKYEKATDNGYFIFVPDEGQLMDRVDIEVDIPISSKTVEYNWGGSYTVLPDEGYLNQVDVNINIPTTYKNVEYTDNGDYSVFAEDGEGYINGVGVKVNVPLEYSQTHTITRNGSYGFTPSPDYKGMEKVTVEVDVQADSVPKIPNGVYFKDSTFTEFDMGEYDWGDVFNWTAMFSDCRQLERIYNFPEDVKIYGSIGAMFRQCLVITELPYFNTEYVGCFREAFRYCQKITTIPEYDFSNAVDISNLFNGCVSLETIEGFDCSKVRAASDVFLNCSNLENIGGMGLKDIKCNFSISSAKKLSEQSLLNIISGLYDFRYNGETPNGKQGTLVVGSENLKKINNEWLSIATDKGWVIKA